MAIYHLTTKIIQRSKGQNVIAAAAYRSASKLFDEQEQHYCNYRNKPDVIHGELLVPENSPEWIKNIVANFDSDPETMLSQLWNKVDAFEKRTDAQLAREIEFALPIELTTEQNIALAREFIRDQIVARGMLAQWNVHYDAGNPHVHVLLTMRRMTEDSFGKRETEWNSKVLLQTWREKWAEYANFHLHLHQHSVRIDHRSYQDQGIDLIPTIHRGKAVNEMHKRGIETDVVKESIAVNAENLKKIIEVPERIFEKLTAQSDTFSDERLSKTLGLYINDSGKSNFEECVAEIFRSLAHHESVWTEAAIAKAVSGFTTNADDFAKALIAIKQSPELIHLGLGDDGRERYTSKCMFEIENKIQSLVDEMKNRQQRIISNKKIEHLLQAYEKENGKSLTDEQRIAVKHILQPAAVTCVVGRAGTGKSFSLGAAKTVWEEQGLYVQGIALSGIASDGLSRDAQIPSRTIESFRCAIEQGNLKLYPHDVLIMDEAGMTDSVSMLAVLQIVHEAGAKLVLVGDPSQIQPVGPGATFRALLECIGFAELQTVYRQKMEWQKQATMDFSAGRLKEALAAYDKHSCIHLDNQESLVLSRLVNDWFATRVKQDGNLEQFLILAHRNKDTRLLNQQIRAQRIEREEITEGYTVQTTNGEIKISKDDRILFLKNDRNLGVSNGRFATIDSVELMESGRVLAFIAILDGSKQRVTINPEHYNEFAHGYAATVHKSQGLTVDHTFVYAGGKWWDRNLTYVAMSRHKDSCHLYAHHGVHKNKQVLFENLSRLKVKDSVLDFPLAFSERRGIHCDATQVLLKERQHAKTVAMYVDKNREVGMAWSALQAKLADIGIEKMSYEENVFSKISALPEYQASQKSLQIRNKLASVIASDFSRYTKAIESYGLDKQKVQTQAEKYICWNRVETYHQKAALGAVVLRDKTAVAIHENIKAHYPYFQQFGVSSDVIKQHALQHEKRQFLSELNTEERQAFRLVENYVSVNRKIGATYGEEKTKTPNSTRQNLPELKQRQQVLACEIMQNPEYCAKALAFFQIGVARRILGYAVNEKAENAAKHRMDKLQWHANKHLQQQQEISAASPSQLKTLLLNYLDGQIKLDACLDAVHVAAQKNREAYQHALAEFKAHQQSFEHSIQPMMQHPEIQQEMKDLQRRQPGETIYQRGGFLAIRERIANNNLQKEDLKMVFWELRARSEQLSRSLSESLQQREGRDRGGRSR
jgi:ATP-dependent exoDNAse (exonuclease V) alpha subunit